MKSPFKINLLLLIIFLFCFAMVLILGDNRVLFIDLNSFAKNSNPFIWENLTLLGDTLSACAIMLLFIRTRPDLIWSGILATLIAMLIVNLIKYYFNIPRPPVIIDRNVINIIGPSLTSHSFPSGHTVTIFTLTALLIFHFKSSISRICLIIMACLVGISRIAVGVHWPEDVLAGAALGILCAMTGVIIVRKLGWNQNKPVQLLIGFLLILANIYLLFFYDCKYKQAVYLQSLLAIAVLVAGINEYYLLIRNR
jgi:membrane-associated phospholipid phosphatase